MKPQLAVLAVIATVALASPSHADMAGSWRVVGKVSAFSFTLDCDFKPTGDHFGGVCADASTSDPKIKPGRAHPLTAGAEHGDAVSWTYKSSFLFQTFDVTFTGVRQGDRITGAITVPGRQGAFTATRP
jgi:hypothetical protein